MYRLMFVFSIAKGVIVKKKQLPQQQQTVCKLSYRGIGVLMLVINPRLLYQTEAYDYYYYYIMLLFQNFHWMKCCHMTIYKY